jgi:hypothetical protein
MKNGKKKKNRNYCLFWNFNILDLTTQNLYKFSASTPVHCGEKFLFTPVTNIFLDWLQQ